jgi:hypothetical protein
MPYTAGHGGGGAGAGGYITTHLSVCSWALLTVVVKVIFVVNSLMHRLKSIVGFDGCE